MKTLSTLAIRIVLFTAVISMICSYSVYAAAGDLDLTFDQVGYSAPAFRGGPDYAHASALQCDGKIILVGSTSNVFSAVRYNADGSLDTLFGRRGLVRVNFGEGTTENPGFVFDGFARAVAIQADGKILVAGAVQYRTVLYGSSDSDLVIVRLNTDGSLDNSFNKSGKIRTRFSSSTSTATAVTVANDGRIIVAGVNSGHSGVLRLNPDGSPDSTFDGDGKLTITNVSWLQNIVTQPDGRIVMVGTQSGPTVYTSDFATVRLNADGSFDTTFNGTGIAPTPAFTGIHRAESVALQPDGKVLVSGTWDRGQVAILRYMPNGEFDNSFGGTGLIIGYSPATDLPVNKISVQADGKVLLASTATTHVSGSSTRTDLLLQRFNHDGSSDGSFNTVGSRSISMGGGNDSLAEILLQPDGKILVTGHRNHNGLDFAMARVTPDGGVDTSFGIDGKVISDIGYGGGGANDVIVQGDGKIVAVGGGDFFAIARYNTDGSLDSQFNGTGTTRIFSAPSYASSIVSQDDGKLLVAGRVQVSSDIRTDSVIVRLDRDGSLDESFASGGKVVVGTGPDTDEFSTIALQADGKIIAAGYAARDNGGASRDLTLLRYTADGVLDVSFGRRGKVIGLGECGTLDTNISAVAIQNDGKILAAGTCGGLAVFRFNEHGSLDTTFNKTGVFVIDSLPPGTFARDLKIQQDGKIVVAGGIISGYEDENFIVARLDVDGNLDTTFNGNGVVSHSVGDLHEVATSLEIQADGKLVVAGDVQVHALRYGSAVVRFNSDGSIDNTWGQQGVRRLSFEANTYAFGTALDGSGRLLVATQFNGFGVVRLVGDLATVSFASVSGQVRDASGQPIPRAVVIMTDSNGDTRTTQASPFGYYNFDDVRTGESYTFTAMAKRYRFTPRSVVVGGDLAGFDIISNQ